MATKSTSNQEIFGRNAVTPVRPITADMCTIIWGSDKAGGDIGKVVTGATNINISYQQQVIRRRTLATAGGSPLAVIYPSQPMGSLQIQRLFADLGTQLTGDATGFRTASVHDIFDLPGWNICNGTASISVTFDGASAYPNCETKAPGYRMTGAVVTGYNISAEAEGLTVVDNVSVEFLQMFRQAAAPARPESLPAA